MNEKPLTRVEAEGRTTEEAIKIALAKLGVPRDEAKIEILAEGNKGLFNMKGIKQTKVRATLKK
ncbi:MAG: Jag N-terminal domain-containing protein [Candidatus Omnitrophota bacterium]|nr:Jag N-terminal domain-containing protein [Candidatus Omnitrophota bacterium]